jgi:hypothetical protein
MPILLPSEIQRAMGRTLSVDELDEAVALIAEFEADLDSILGHSVSLHDVVGEKVDVAGYNSGLTISNFASGVTSVTVSYQGGHGPAHPAYPSAKGAIKRRVIRMLAKRDDDAIGTDSVSAPGLTVRYLDEGFTESELKPLKRMRRVVVAFDRADGAVFAPLARTPVQAVTAVTIDGIAGSVGTHYRVVRNGLELLGLYSLPTPISESVFR